MGLFRYRTGILIKRLDHEQEINYEIFDEDGYICRLVPGYCGFEMSKLDYSLGVEVSPGLINAVTDYILNEDA